MSEIGREIEEAAKRLSEALDEQEQADGIDDGEDEENHEERVQGAVEDLMDLLRGL